MRCPAELLRGGPEIPRLARLDSAAAQELLCEGRAFVVPMEGLLGDRLRRWDFGYLREHLPSEQRYGVMLDEGSGKIVMSHSARNGQRQVDAAALAEAGGGGARGSSADLAFGTSDQTRMTFPQFLEEARRFRESGCKGKLPYFGIHLLWRFKPEDNGYLGNIDEAMQDDLWSIRFDRIKEWQEENMLPLVQRFYLFAGLGGTLYHCHYDLQPNLHVQLSGRKRFVLFPPDAWPHLYPFPVHHDLDRRSMVDLDAPDSAKFPTWPSARGAVVELSPGDALYIPPFWWHHVQSLTPETTSMAMWFFEFFPLSARVPYGLGPQARDLSLMRDVEELVGRHFPDAPGEEECTRSRPVKAAQVAAFMRWLRGRLAPGGGAPGRPPGELLEAPEVVEARALRLVEEGLGDEVTGAPADAARAKLRRFLECRF